MNITGLEKSYKKIQNLIKKLENEYYKESSKPEAHRNKNYLIYLDRRIETLHKVKKNCKINMNNRKKVKVKKK